MKPYFEQNGITIFHGDCREVIESLPISSIDLLLTDPPYSDDTHQGARTGEGDRKLVDFDSITLDKLRRIWGLMGPACKAWSIAFMDWQHTAGFKTQTPDFWQFVRMGIWVKPNGAPQFTGDRPGQGFESLCIMHRGGKMSWNGGGRHAVWTYNKINGDHPTQKPLSFVTELVGLFSNPGDLVFDPFMGAGTTLLAAKNTGRRAIGIELEEKWCEVAARRLSQEVLPFDFSALG